MTARRSAVVLPLVLAALFSACASNPSAPEGGSVVRGGKRIPAKDFDTFKRDFAAEARAAGVSQRTVDRVVPDLTLLPAIIKLDQRQPEFTKPVWSYLADTVNKARIDRGRELRKQYANILNPIAGHTGVPAELIVAIWGMETNFGDFTGKTSVYDALATLAFEGRRAEFYHKELIAALKLVDRGDLPAGGVEGSWAGAMGQTQFMPSTWLKYAVDGDGDGRIDLQDSLADAFASTAAFLAASGWSGDLAWGCEARVPGGFDWRLAGEDKGMTLGQWSALGFERLDGQPLTGGARATLFAPAGHTGPVLLLSDSFRAILKYNQSTNYALAVLTLAERMAGRTPIHTPWPTDLRMLSATELREMQERLTGLGFDAGEADGKVGAKTRTALRNWQASVGRVADGYPTADDLARLREMTVPLAPPAQAVPAESQTLPAAAAD